MQTQEVCGSGNWVTSCHSPPPRDIFLWAILHSQTHSNLLGKEAPMDSPGIWPPLGAASGAVKDKKKLRRLYPAGTVDVHAARVTNCSFELVPSWILKTSLGSGQDGAVALPRKMWLECGRTPSSSHTPASTRLVQSLPCAWQGLLRNWYRRTIWEVGQRRVGGLSGAAREHR